MSWTIKMLGISAVSLYLTSSLSVALADQPTSSQAADWDRRLEALRAVPYVGFTEESVDESQAGVTYHDSISSWQGYNFYSTMSSGEAFLLDMDGNTVHRWKFSPERRGSAQHAFINDYAIMLADGDLVGIENFGALVRVNWDSEPIWRVPLEAHHDVVQAEDGSFYVLVREFQEHRELRVRFDAIMHLSAAGKFIDKWSTYDHLAEIKSRFETRSFLDTILDEIEVDSHSVDPQCLRAIRQKLFHLRGEYFHVNTISLLPATELGERDARFERGNLLVCFRNVNQIAILQKDTYRILWVWGAGELQWPHHPTMLPNGHVLVFDNGVQRKYSRVVELDPTSGEIVWKYMAEPPDAFFSYLRGSAQRLPNGNTLICESDRGHVFEVTRQGTVVWSWLNPAIRRGHREVVYRMKRLPLSVAENVDDKWWWWE